MNWTERNRMKIETVRLEQYELEIELIVISDILSSKASGKMIGIFDLKALTLKIISMLLRTLFQ